MKTVLTVIPVVLYRTTTPNSLREHLKETLVKNLGSNDLSDTIQSIRDDEIRDTFGDEEDIDGENVETPPAQRRAARHRSFRLPLSNTNRPSSAANEEEEADDAAGSIGDLSNRRKGSRFRSAGEGGGAKPLGDRELMLRKNRASSLAEVGGGEEDEEDLGAGLFDRFSTARR